MFGIVDGQLTIAIEFCYAADLPPQVPTAELLHRSGSSPTSVLGITAYQRSHDLHQRMGAPLTYSTERQRINNQQQQSNRMRCRAGSDNHTNFGGTGAK